MFIEIDFSSDEAIYQQLCNQIILGIATEQYTEGQVLPSVRQLADQIGINMHTVNKAYTVLKQEGFVKVDRRRGAVISVDSDKQRALEAVRGKMEEAIAEAICRGLSRDDMHGLIDQIFDRYEAYIAQSAGTAGDPETANGNTGEEENGSMKDGAGPKGTPDGPRNGGNPLDGSNPLDDEELEDE